MATFPGPNDGAYPIDLTTDVGSLRSVLGDTVGEEYDPPVAGRRNYEVFGDVELQALLNMSGDSVPSAVGYAYLKLAGLAAGQSVDWRSDDLSVTMSKTPAELRAISQMWFERGSLLDSEEGFFLSGEFAEGCGCDPELAAKSIYYAKYCEKCRW